MPNIYSPLSFIGGRRLAVKTTPLLNNSDRNTTRHFMNLSLLELLRCPYCGNRLSLVDNISLKRVSSTVDSGVLGCECCAFPVVSGIPTLIANVLWLAFMTMFFILCLASTRGYKAKLDETEVRMRSIISDD